MKKLTVLLAASLLAACSSQPAQQAPEPATNPVKVVDPAQYQRPYLDKCKQGQTCK